MTIKKYQNILNGSGVDSPHSFESKNPATGETLGLVPHSTAEQVAQAVASARAAQPAWAARPDDERKSMVARVADMISENAQDLARWVTREQGKPLGGVGAGEIPGALFEIAACEAWTRVPAGLELPIEVVFEDDTRRDELHRTPYGVVAAIAPWNWPLMIAIWQIIPAIRAGNTVVLKPSEYTSIGTLELARVISAVLPPGVLNTVTGLGAVGSALVENPDVDKIMFTGSTATGIKIAAAAARNLTPSTLELGGNDPAIVLPDADPHAIAMGLFWGAFINMGQTCACAKRVYVHESLHDALVAELKVLVEAMPMGNGMEPSIAMGPIQNAMQFEKVVALVDSARAAGATIVTGGQAPGTAGYFYPLTLVTDIQDGADLVDEEQFGPALPIIKYRDIDLAVASANRLGAGLGASVWSADTGHAMAVAKRIQAGTVWINQHGAVHPMVPFGGVKGSGWGVEFGVDGLKSVTQTRVISLKK
ncbi:aldehyde dehydrogenase family protein [Variovorax sp. J31P207]|uniref:aldehyde dehydrogenase family protein n=1 Tax=Variovorax sp. J31P207 TaxID=3053510 RepID=UPI0025772609|nr:aldehyde dehydrogenase family protein [Variovorax sp. J31P207]MDM0071439.1 aldehyde dehydrogenase family protein [Variovorax sp. J31P207]